MHPLRHPGFPVYRIGPLSISCMSQKVTKLEMNACFLIHSKIAAGWTIIVLILYFYLDVNTVKPPKSKYTCSIRYTEKCQIMF